MNSPSLFVFHEVLHNSFATALEGLLGRGVRDEVYRILESKGIGRDDVPSRFDKGIEVLQQVFRRVLTRNHPSSIASPMREIFSTS